MRRFNLQELKQLETISEGHTGDLKVDTGTTRIWLSRCTIADGEPYDNKVTVETLIEGSWYEVDSYRAE